MTDRPHSMSPKIAAMSFPILAWFAPGLRRAVPVLAAIVCVHICHAETHGKSLGLAVGGDEKGDLAARDLRCEYMASPLGIDAAQPRLSWKLAAGRPAQGMTAYQVLVATRPEWLEPTKSDVWDSGRVEGEDFTAVLFRGKRLESGRGYHWKVRCWDGNGRVGDWSEAATWRMGLLAAADWPKEWLGAPRVGPAPQAGLLGPEFHPVWQFRHEFKLKARPASATLYLAAVGIADLWVNGRPASDAVLDPALTEFRQRVPCVARDLTSVLQVGDNCLGIRLGNGFASPVENALAFPLLAPRFQAVLRLEYPDGSAETISSSTGWRASLSDVTYNCLFGGESIDARRHNPRWSVAGVPTDDGEAPAIVEAPTGVRHAQMAPPMRVTEVIRPVSIRRLKPDVWLVDWGVNVVGWPRFRGHGKAGAEARIFWNERLYPDGSLQKNNNNRNTAGPLPKENRGHASVYARFQEVRVTFSGAARDEFEPRFTYGSGRYVQIEGLDYEPELADIEGCVVHTDLAPAGTFECSHELINRLHAACVRTYRGNWHGMPTDNPAREKLGWAREGLVAIEGAIFNFDALHAYEKWIGDFRDAQAASGVVPFVIPDRNNPTILPPTRADPWYGGVICRVPWVLYERYGDRKVLRDTYAGMKKYVDLMLRHFPNGLVTSFWRDHTAMAYFQNRDAQNAALTMTSAGEADKIFPTPHDLFGGMAFFDNVSIVARTATVLGESADAAKYGAAAEKIRAALNARMDPATGAYAPDSQTLQSLALTYGVARPEDRARVFDYLCQNIISTRQRHLATGAAATRDLFKVVTELGRGDLAMDMINQTDYPSYGQMLENELGVVWERWDGKAALCQSGLNSIDEWMYHSLAGIQPDPAAPGFKHIRFQPGVLKGLTYARATYESIRGRIVSDWKREGNRLALRIEVPVGSTGTVVLPVNQAAAVEAPPEARLEADSAGKPTWRVGAGSWEFLAHLPPEQGLPEVPAPPSRPVVAATPANGHFVGELFGGGIVFWVTPDGRHGLVASLHDLDGGSGVSWSNVIDELAGATVRNPYGLPPAGGRGGTAEVLGQPGHTSSAARLCVDYRGGGFSDWYLPSRIELQVLSARTELIGKRLSLDGDPDTQGLHTAYVMPTFGAYWSSTETNADCAWVYDFNFSGDLAYFGGDDQPVGFHFSPGNVALRAKELPLRVRAVRQF